MGKIIIPVELTTISVRIRVSCFFYRLNLKSMTSAVSQFSDNQELQGESWANIKTQLMDYQLLFRGMLCALDEIVDDCNNLISGCGNENLIEDEITARIEQLKELNRRYQAIIDRILNAIRNDLLTALNPSAYQTVMNSQAAIALNLGLIKLLERKLQRIEEIEASTAHLFSTAIETLSLVDQGIASVKTAWNGVRFVNDTTTDWRDKLYKVFEEKKKKRLDEIRSQYQVEDDTVLHDWELGWPLSLFMDPIHQLTQTEADLIKGLALWELPAFQDARNNAYTEADNRFPQGSHDDDHNDAFRHAFWNALMTTDIGEGFASQFATAHEGVPGNPPNREAMDLYNNEVGRRIASDNPGASHSELADLIEQAINNGELLVIDANGDLAWSNQVPLGQCGLSTPDDPLPGRPRDEFTVDTGSGG
jgi:hypothetical protein